AGLLVVGRAPGLRSYDIRGKRNMVAPLVRNVRIDVRQWRAAAARESAAGPRVALPGGDGAVLLTGDLDLSVCRRTMSGDGLLGSPVQEDLDRLAAGLLREDRAHFGPCAGCELATEAAADVIHLHFDIGGGNLEV